MRSTPRLRSVSSVRATSAGPRKTSSVSSWNCVSWSVAAGALAGTASAPAAAIASASARRAPPRLTGPAAAESRPGLARAGAAQGAAVPGLGYVDVGRRDVVLGQRVQRGVVGLVGAQRLPDRPRGDERGDDEAAGDRDADPPRRPGDAAAARLDERAAPGDVSGAAQPDHGPARAGPRPSDQ